MIEENGPGSFRTIRGYSFSNLISLREKLEKWEQEYYRKNKKQVDIRKHYSAEELAEQARLQKLLGD